MIKNKILDLIVYISKIIVFFFYRWKNKTLSELQRYLLNILRRISLCSSIKLPISNILCKLEKLFHFFNPFPKIISVSTIVSAPNNSL